MSRIDLFSHRLNENLFQRRLHQLELVNRRLLRRLAQQILRIAMRLQTNLRLPAVVLVIGNRRMLQERSCRPRNSAAPDCARSATSPRASCPRAPPGRRLIRQIASHSFSTWSMRCVENRIAFPAFFRLDQRVLQQRRVHRIESRERLVHNDQLRLMQQRGNELDLLLHALRQLFGLLLRRVQNLQPLAPVVRALARRPRDRGRAARP